ncbi:MAG TPA: alanyl-tRNA editing protein [Povalibacter sp.]|nr:alanyl-tRNA editing protein [Povalibacter sp.]
MAIYLCHEQPDLYDFAACVVQARPGALLLDRSALHPGGGGQVADRALASVGGETLQITGVQPEGDAHWHLLDRDVSLSPGDQIEVHVDRAHRSRVAQLHTATHILNALVFQRFAGALVTGAQISADGTARMDFDLPNVDNDHLRALEPDINDIIRQGLDVNAIYVSTQEAEREPGLIRSMSVAPPPTPDGRLRVIDIVGLDRQACGGTHLTNTGQCARIAVTKVENKGRQNRRVRIALVET